MFQSLQWNTISANLSCQSDWGCGYLHLDVENADPAFICHILHSLYTGAVVVPSELGVLYEPVLRNEVQEGFFGREIVLASVLLAWFGWGGINQLINQTSHFPDVANLVVEIELCLCINCMGLADFLERPAERGKNARETENPNLSGYSAKRRFSSVDLPVPEGPEITTGRNFWTVY